MKNYCFNYICCLFTFFLFVMGTGNSHARTQTTDSLSLKFGKTINTPIGYENILFETVPTRYITGAVSGVKGNSLEKNFNTEFTKSLFGRVAGLYAAQGSYEPGFGVSQLYVRGINNFGDAQNTPLVVIDGFITNDYGLSNALTQLVPEEIESITVLKDAEAAVFFGARAANGVVLVTTRKGIKEGLNVKFSMKQGFMQAQQLPEFLDAYNYALLYNEAQRNDGVYPQYTMDDLHAYQTKNDPYFHPDVNWYNEVLRKNAPVSAYNLSLQGGNDFVRYFTMANVMNSQGLLKKFGNMDKESVNSDYSRYNFRTNIDMKITDIFSAEFKIGGSIEETSNPHTYSTYSLYNLLARVPPNSFPVYNPDGSWGGNATYSNPYADLISTGFRKTNSRTILSSLKVTADLGQFVKGLKISGVASLNNYFRSGSVKSKSYERFAVSLNTAGDTIYSNPIGQLTSLSGSEETLDQYRNMIFQGFINYDRLFGANALSVIAMMGTDNVVRYAPADESGGPSASSTDPYKHNDGALKVRYVRGNKYILSGTVAYTGSDFFAPGKRYGIFPSASAGWIISEENFLRNHRIVDFLKLRVSYGMTGNDIITTIGTYDSRYGYYPRYGGQSYYFGTNNGYANGSFLYQTGNEGLTWEKEKQLNLGFDMTLWKNIEMSFDFFNRHRKDILVSSDAKIPLFAGIYIPYLNLGRARNSGFDVSLQYRNASNAPLQFVAGLNLTYYKTKVLYNAEPVQINPHLYATGRRINQPIGYKSLGFYTPEDIEKRKSDITSIPGVLTETIQAGDIKYADIGGPEGKPDGIIDSYDRTAIGNPGLPQIFGGATFGLRYKGFDLDVVFEGAGGNSVALMGNYFAAFQNNGQAGTIALNRWTPETASTATYPRLSAEDNLNNYLYSDFWQRDGSYLKLRSAEIGYTFSHGLLEKVRIHSVRLFMNGTNLFSLDGIPYGDPSALTGFPVMRTFTAGLNIHL